MVCVQHIFPGAKRHTLPRDWWDGLRETDEWMSFFIGQARDKPILVRWRRSQGGCASLSNRRTVRAFWPNQGTADRRATAPSGEKTAQYPAPGRAAGRKHRPA